MNEFTEKLKDLLKEFGHLFDKGCGSYEGYTSYCSACPLSKKVVFDDCDDICDVLLKLGEELDVKWD